MRWYQRVTVQAALISGAAAILGAVILAIATLASRSGGLAPTQQPPVAKRTESPRPKASVAGSPGSSEVLLVADLSPSMVDTPLGKAVAEYVQGLDPQTKVGLVVFDETVRFVLPPGRYPISEFKKHLHVNRRAICTDLHQAVRGSMESLSGSVSSSRTVVLFSDAVPEPCGATPSRSSSWEFEKKHANIEVEVVLLGKADAKETQRLFPYARLINKYVGIGGRVFPQRP